jgi:Sulfotransferase family
MRSDMAVISKAPLHERMAPLGWIRRPLCKFLFSFLGKIADTDEAKAIAVTTLKGLLNRDQGLLASQTGQTEPPYPDLGGTVNQARTCDRTDIVFITARFRTGSTLLWNLFRNMGGMTAYYEPLNERRWFDPSSRGDRLDPTHRKVSDYWKEYEALGELGDYYREAWIDHDLLMGPAFWDPHLKRYVELLVEGAKGRPVFQFNRIDFRLPWFRSNFPGAKVVHLYRHPRDQWCSCFLNGDFFPPDGTVSQFARYDGFYLLNWAKDLRYHFPFLDEQSVSHPYQLFYYIWKLSYLFGRKYAHYSFAYERLVENPEKEIAKLQAALEIPHHDLANLCALVDKPAQGKWKKYADDAWFKRYETVCEKVLGEFLQHHT